MWTTVKNTLDCKSSITSEAHNPKPVRKKKKNCCKPKTNSASSESAVKDVIHRNRRRFEDEESRDCSPVSVRSSDLVNPDTRNFRLTNSRSRVVRDNNNNVCGGGSPYLVVTGSPTPRLSRLRSGSRSNLGLGTGFSNGSLVGGESGRWGVSCRKCGESLVRKDSEEHYLSKHAVTEVLEEDSTKKIIEMIFMAGWTKPDNHIPIHRILKIHSPETKLAHFEEYRETVKIRATRLQYSKKHPRCLADGNELLRFYGTTLACSLGENGASNLCNLQMCNLCNILRHGFSIYNKESNKQSVLGIFTTSTSEAAYKSIDNMESCSAVVRKALILCRVIAGRVHKPMVDTSQDVVAGRKSGFDSFAGELGSNRSHIEELYLSKANALLPCFVIVC